MHKKPQDMLEFFRRASAEEPGETVAVAAEEEREPSLEATPRLQLVRRSQIVVAAVAAGLAVILAFVLGLALGGDEVAPVATQGVGGWVIRVISYDDNPRNEEIAQGVMGFLAKQYPQLEVTLQRIPSQEQIVVTVGSWVHHPDRYPRARQLLDEVRKIDDKRSGKLHFSEAYFWRIER
jgi:hypothetical protein